MADVNEAIRTYLNSQSAFTTLCQKIRPMRKIQGDPDPTLAYQVITSTTEYTHTSSSLISTYQFKAISAELSTASRLRDTVLKLLTFLAPGTYSGVTIQGILPVKGGRRDIQDPVTGEFVCMVELYIHHNEVV